MDARPPSRRTGPARARPAPGARLHPARSGRPRRPLRALPRPGRGGPGEHLGTQAGPPGRSPRHDPGRAPERRRAASGALPVIALLGLRGAGKTTIGTPAGAPAARAVRRARPAGGGGGGPQPRRDLRPARRGVLPAARAGDARPRAARSQSARPGHGRRHRHPRGDLRRVAPARPDHLAARGSRRPLEPRASSRATAGPWRTTRRPWRSCAACSPRAAPLRRGRPHRRDLGRGDRTKSCAGSRPW